MVRMDCSYIVVPLDVFATIVPVAYRLDYDYIGSTRCWKLHKDKDVPYEVITMDHITAMKVAEILK